MKINRITYRNHRTGWKTENLKLRNLNLLVGASGVGKTQILRAILSLKQIAGGASVNGADWEVEFEQDSKHYVWKGKFASVDVQDDLIVGAEPPRIPFVSETLECETEILVKRDQHSLFYKGDKTVKLDDSVSALQLLKAEEAITPAHDAFMQIYELENDDLGIKISPRLMEDAESLDSRSKICSARNLSPTDKLFLLKQNVPDLFDEIKNDFIDIFTNVEDIDFSLGMFFNGSTFPVLQIKEKNTDKWIDQNNISSGMRRCLSEIITLHLANDGDVILVDEFENSLGVNCINVMADKILTPDADVQFVITSHHPYIINSIPTSAWRIVTRKGSEVRSVDAKSLDIGTYSKHDAFMQLMQNDAFTNGIIS